MDEDLLKRDGFRLCREIPGRGMCGLMDFACYVGLCYGIRWQDGADGGYCCMGYYSFNEPTHAVVSLVQWDGAGDPPGDWVKHKGGMREYNNPAHRRPGHKPLR